MVKKPRETRGCNFTGGGVSSAKRAQGAKKRSRPAAHDAEGEDFILSHIAY